MDRHYFFSAPGRVEIGGNHTDHQHGCVLAAAVNLETRAAIVLNNSNTIRIASDGYAPFEIDLRELYVHEEEKNTSAALVRGVAAAFAERGCAIHGFQARVSSSVYAGSGLSSSAAFEVLIGRALNGMFCDNKLSAVDIAQIGQFAENVYFGKPCGLMDQMASSVGGLVYIDFATPTLPIVKRIPFDFSRTGYALCIIRTGGDHADDTGEYAAIPEELRSVSQVFGKEYLRDVEEQTFFASLPEVRRTAGDRAVLRAIHYYAENNRVQEQVQMLENDDMEGFLSRVNASGISSWTCLQNVLLPQSRKHQELAFSLALCKRLLNGRGAVRVHGGGFAGTALAFVPNDMLDAFADGVQRTLGSGACQQLVVK